MKAIFKNNLPFLIPYFLFLLVGGFVIIINSKAETHLAFNAFHSSFFDGLATYITYLGDGVTAILIMLMMLAIKYRYALIIGLSYILSSLITQALKHFVFDDIVRPKKFFEGMKQLYFVPGTDNHLYYSFPSGHSTCAFALFFSCSMLVNKNGYKFLFFCVALFAAISRVYLSQHFFEDIYVGSVIGVLTSFMIYHFIQKKNHPKIDKSIISLFNND